MQNKETVVLVHGLAGSRLDMWPLSRRLKRVGYAVRNWGYYSVGNRIEAHAERLGRKFSTLDRELSGSCFHVVTQSMGGIIVRTIFEKMRFENLGRVVMLAPPHRGSHVARMVAPWLDWLAPSLTQLSDSPDSYVNNLPNSFQQHRIEFGIVEAKKDRVIAPGGVQLDGHRDFASVNGQHAILTWYPQTAELVENFLKCGSFECGEEPTSKPVQHTVDALQ